MRHVIIGGSIAGISAAKAIRAADAKAEITILSEEKSRPYYRPMITFLIRKQDLDITFEDDLEKKYGLTFIPERAGSIDVMKKKVMPASGRSIAYDRLLIATGSSPVIPEVPGINGQGVFAMRTAEDALAVKTSADRSKAAVILGGGLAGIKSAIALKKYGLDVTIVEKLDGLLSRGFDRRGAEIISKILRNGGLHLLTGDSISEVVRDEGKIKAVNLSSGRALHADLVIVAVGACPNLELAKDSGIKTNKGILINENLLTSVPDVYAAGDVVEYTDLVTGMPAVSALWTNAEEMGRLAGRNMAGAGLKYQGFFSVLNSTEIFDVPVMAVGLIDPDPADKNYEVVIEDNIDSYKKLVFRGSILAGAVFINNVENAGIYTNLIRNRIPIGPLKEEAIKGSLRYINFIRTVPEQVLIA